MTDRFVGAHGEEVSHERREARSKAALCDEAELQLSQANCVVTTLPVPARDVQQVALHHHAAHRPALRSIHLQTPTSFCSFVTNSALNRLIFRLLRRGTSTIASAVNSVRPTTVDGLSLYAYGCVQHNGRGAARRAVSSATCRLRKLPGFDLLLICCSLLIYCITSYKPDVLYTKVDAQCGKLMAMIVDVFALLFSILQ